MGIYAITGASSGIGACTAELLNMQGHEVVNIDSKNGDITVDLSTFTGRQTAINRLHELYPEGLDGMICNAGVSATCGNPALILSVNYFAAVTIADGVFELLRKKRGACVFVSSNSIAQGEGRMDFVGLMNNHGREMGHDYRDEERILALVKDVPPTACHSFYVASKYALARWVRRVSADWASKGVRINAVAPGNVESAMTTALSPQHMAAMEALPVPVNYGTRTLMDPIDIANAIVFLSSPEAHGINGVILFVDGGTDALLNSEKVY